MTPSSYNILAISSGEKNNTAIYAIYSLLISNFTSDFHGLIEKMFIRHYQNIYSTGSQTAIRRCVSYGPRMIS
jgi:hypothetical protein